VQWSSIHRATSPRHVEAQTRILGNLIARSEGSRRDRRGHRESALKRGKYSRNAPGRSI
jgi:hypothetical protein